MEAHLTGKRFLATFNNNWLRCNLHFWKPVVLQTFLPVAKRQFSPINTVRFFNQQAQQIDLSTSNGPKTTVLVV